MEDDEVPVVEPFQRRRARSNTDLLIAAKLGKDEQEEGESFRERLWAAWSAVALEQGHDTLGCDQIRSVFQSFGLADQINDDALFLMVDMLDQDGDGKITFQELMDGLKFWLAGVSGSHTEGENSDGDVDSVQEEEHFGDLSKEQTEQLRVLFKGFDTESNGYLNRVQINRLLETLKREWGKQSSSHEEIFDTLKAQLLSSASATSDGDIHLSPEDFLNVMARISEALKYQAAPEKPKEQVFEVNTTPTSTPTTSRRGPPEDTYAKQQLALEVQELKQAHSNLKAQNEQYQRRLHEATQLSKSTHKELMKQKEALEKAQKQVKNLQGQKEKVTYYSELVENQKATLLEKDKTEQELLKINTKLVAENEEAIAQHMKTQETLKALQDEYSELQDKYKSATQAFKQKTGEQESLLSEFKEKQNIVDEELKQLRAMVSFLKEQKNKLELQVSQEQMQLSTAHAEIISLRNNNAKLIRKEKKKTLNSFLNAKKEGGNGEETEVEEKTAKETDIFANSLLSELEQAELENIGKKENEEVTDLKKLIDERETRLLELEKEVKAKQTELEMKEQQWKGEMDATRGELKGLKDELSERQEKMNALREQMEEMAKANSALKSVDAELRERLALKDQELRTTLRNALERLSQSQEGEINALKAERDELERELERMEREYKKLEKQKAKELKMVKMEFELDRTLEAKRKKGEIMVARGGIGSGRNSSEAGGGGGGLSGWWNVLVCAALPSFCMKEPEEFGLPTNEEFEMRRHDSYSALREGKKMEM